MIFTKHIIWVKLTSSKTSNETMMRNNIIGIQSIWVLKLTFFKSFWASSAVKGTWKGERGMHCCWEREKAERLGIRILWSVPALPSTFSAKRLSTSAGKGSLAPKSPSMSPLPTALILLLPKERVGLGLGLGLRWAWWR